MTDHQQQYTSRREQREGLRIKLRDQHAAFHHDLPKLERAAWEAARTTSSQETIVMMRTLNALRDELLHHCKLAESLVYPFLGESRAAGIARAHLADQRRVERALDAAGGAAHGALVEELARFAPRVAAFLEVERRLLSSD